MIIQKDVKTFLMRLRGTESRGGDGLTNKFKNEDVKVNNTYV